MSVKFTYDDSTKTLVIEDGSAKKAFKLSDERSEIFYYILKAIDGLDNNEFQEVAQWAVKDDTSEIPNGKIPKAEAVADEDAGFTTGAQVYSAIQAIPAELPALPTTDGTYKLVVTVADGSDPVYEWVANA